MTSEVASFQCILPGFCNRCDRFLSRWTIISVSACLKIWERAFSFTRRDILFTNRDPVQCNPCRPPGWRGACLTHQGGTSLLSRSSFVRLRVQSDTCSLSASHIRRVHQQGTLS